MTDASVGRLGDPLAALAAVPAVAEAVASARAACEALRWHEAFRRRWREVRAEAGLRAAAASAALDGAPVGVELLRAWATGAGGPAHGTDLVAAGALRAQAVVEAALPPLGGRGGTAALPLPQLVARVHAAAAADLLPAAELGRPRTGAARDLRGLGQAPAPELAAARLAALAGAVAGTAAPGVVVAGVVHAELLVARPFAAANGVVARAVARWLTTTTGLDPTGTVLPEPAWQAAPAPYLAAAARYATGTPDGVTGWLVAYADAVRAGAEAARGVADAVLAGRSGGTGRQGDAGR